MGSTGHEAGLEGEERKVLGGRGKVNVHYRLMLTSAHNTVFDCEYQQSASLNSGLYTMMLTHLFCLTNLLITAKSIAVVLTSIPHSIKDKSRAFQLNLT